MPVFFWTLKALLSHWRRHPVQFFSVLTGLWLATSLLTGVQALNSQARESYAKASQLIGGEPQKVLVAPNGANYSQELFISLRRAGWPVSPALRGRVTLKDRPDQRLVLLGIEPVTLPANTALAGQTLDTEQVVSFFTPPGSTWISPQTMQALGLHEGERPQTDTGQTLPPLRAQADMAPGLLLMDIGFAQQVLNQPDQISRMILPSDFAEDPPPLPDEMKGELVIRKSGEDNDLGRLTESFHLNLDALGFLSFVVGLFIVHAAIGLALEQRRGLLRNLRACGVSVRGLIASLVIELGVLALMGGIAGVMSGYWLASVLLPDVAASLRGLYGAEVAGHLNLSIWWWLSGLGVALLGAFLAGASSLLRATRLPLLALANEQAWHDTHARWLKRQGWIAGVCALIALLAALLGNSLALGFVLMASLLLSAALGLPVLLNALLNVLLGKSRSVLGQWFLADCRQQLPALSLALMALLLAMAANIGAGSMTSGFRQTFTHWLEQRLSAELYINPQNPAQAAPLQKWLSEQPLTRAVLPNWQVSLQLRGWPAELYGVIDNALSNIGATEFLDILLHEFGHHIDNVLRRDFADYLDEGSALLAPDASGEEGAHFSFWMAWFGHFDSDLVRIATCRPSHDDEPLAITVDWPHARQVILQRHDRKPGNADHRHQDPDRERFEAGDGDAHHMTHFEIEAILGQSGFLEKELKSLYFGNWLRDYSQVLDPKIVRATDMPKNFPDVLSREALTRIVDVLSIKRFGEMRKAEPRLFTVTPEVLGVYRPSEHIDNPKNTDPNAPDPTTRDPDFEPLIQDGNALLEVDYDTSMKRYIERSVDFMERELRTALKEKYSHTSLRALGSALHVLEDFFAHSNFVELALIKNGYEKVLPWTSPADCKAGLPLVTGMFGSTDVLASLAGPLGEILFSIEDITYMPIKAGDRSPREQVLLILLEEHHDPLYLDIFQRFLTARDEWVDLPFGEFLQRSAAYLQGASAVTGNGVGVIMHGVLSLFGQRIDDWQTRYGQDPHENGTTDPTHSQLAKDHAEHPLHLLAASLAAQAVKAVGAAMAAYWSGDGSADPIAVARSYFMHPQDTDWQDERVRAWAQNNPEDVRRSTSKTELRKIHEQLGDTGKQALEQMRKDSVAYLSFLRGEFQDKRSPFWALMQVTPAGAAVLGLFESLGFFKQD